MIRLLITKGDNEEVLAVLVCKDSVPPIKIEHEGVQYIFKRRWMHNIYAYVPSKRKQIDDFLDN